mmetsp:Transcript_15047/g.28467  ORF Transcript_15047/g.28467 Transcript_15047/m.28467 type:complete len:90 (+) Transcript_15047:525-794(+)
MIASTLMKGNEIRFGDAFLKEGKFMGGFAEPTIADFSMISAIEFAKVIKGLKWEKSVEEYYERFNKAVPGFAKGAAICRGYVKSCYDKQ